MPWIGLQAIMMALVIAFPVAVMQQLRGPVKELGVAAEKLSEAERQQVEGQQHVPLAITRQLTSCLSEARERGAVPIICLRKGRPIPLSPIPYGSDEWKRLYRGRAAVEREFGRLKTDYGLAPLRVRGLERIQLHADLVMLGRLALALSRAQEVALAA
jgi:transposase